jgi:hypothetical protein
MTASGRRGSGCLHPTLTVVEYAEIPLYKTPSRNSLENRDGSRIGTSIGAEGGPRSLDRSPLAAKEARSRGLQLFSKPFLHALECIRAMARAARPRPSPLSFLSQARD